MKYDDASWHCGGDFPEDLPESAGGTHIGMFVAWAMLNGLAGELFTEECPDDLKPLQDRTMTPGDWFLSHCDGKFIDEELNELGNNFAQAYYSVGDSMPYAADYERTFPDAETIYHVPDSWASFDLLSPIIRTRFENWRRTGSIENLGTSIPKPWWQFWK